MNTIKKAIKWMGILFCRSILGEKIPFCREVLRRHKADASRMSASTLKTDIFQVNAAKKH